MLWAMEGGIIDQTCCSGLHKNAKTFVFDQSSARGFALYAPAIFHPVTIYGNTDRIPHLDTARPV